MLRRPLKTVEEITNKYGHEVVRLPSYHYELNTIELIWADEKKVCDTQTQGNGNRKSRETVSKTER